MLIGLLVAKGLLSSNGVDSLSNWSSGRVVGGTRRSSDSSVRREVVFGPLPMKEWEYSAKLENGSFPNTLVSPPPDMLLEEVTLFPDSPLSPTWSFFRTSTYEGGLLWKSVMSEKSVRSMSSSQNMSSDLSRAF